MSLTIRYLKRGGWTEPLNIYYLQSHFNMGGTDTLKYSIRIPARNASAATSSNHEDVTSRDRSDAAYYQDRDGHKYYSLLTRGSPVQQLNQMIRVERG